MRFNIEPFDTESFNPALFNMKEVGHNPNTCSGYKLYDSSNTCARVASLEYGLRVASCEYGQTASLEYGLRVSTLYKVCIRLYEMIIRTRFVQRCASPSPRLRVASVEERTYTRASVQVASLEYELQVSSIEYTRAVLTPKS